MLRFLKPNFTGQVRTDLACIPKEKTDENYVDMWLKAQLVEYEQAVGKGASNIIFQVGCAGFQFEAISGDICWAIFCFVFSKV